MSRLEKDEKNIKPKYNNHLIHEKSPYLQQHEMKLLGLLKKKINQFSYQ
jgi:hypothetical protein